MALGTAAVTRVVLRYATQRVTTTLPKEDLARALRDFNASRDPIELACFHDPELADGGVLGTISVVPVVKTPRLNTTGAATSIYCDFTLELTGRDVSGAHLATCWDAAAAYPAEHLRELVAELRTRERAVQAGRSDRLAAGPARSHQESAQTLS